MSPTPSPSHRPGYKWELLALLWLANFLNQGDRQIYNAILPSIQASLGATDVQMGLVATIFTLCYGVLVPVAGWLGDRASRKNVVCLSLLVFSSGTLLTGLGGGLLALILFRSIATGAGESFYTPSALSLIGEHHERTRSFAMALNQSALYVGVVASSWLAGKLAETFGWKAAFWSFGSFGVLLACVLFWRLQPDRAPAAGAAEKSAAAASVWPILLRPSVLLQALAFGCMVFATTGFMTWMPTLLYTKFQMPLAQAALQAVFLHYLFALAGVLVGGWWSDRRARVQPAGRMFTGAAGLALAAPFVFLLGQADTLAASGAMLALFGFCRGVYDANIFAALYDVVPERHRATATGFIICFAYVAGSAAPLILGQAKQTIGLGLGIALLAPVYLIGGLLLALSGRYFLGSGNDQPAAASARRG